MDRDAEHADGGAAERGERRRRRHVFSARHAQALDELRGAQIALAQAWARSEATRTPRAPRRSRRWSSRRVRRMRARTTRARGWRRSGLRSLGLEGWDGAGAGRSRSSTGGSVRSVTSETEMEGNELEEEAEHDILLARRRREANDRYFQRVNAACWMSSRSSKRLQKQ